MPDEFRFAVSPIVTERNARRLVDILAQLPPDGDTSEGLRRRFEEVTGLRRQSFYDTLAYCKHRGWVIGGGHSKLYRLNSDGSWKPLQTSAGQRLEKDQLEHVVNLRAQQVEELQSEVERLRDWSGGGDADGAGVALSSLLQIVSNTSSTIRQKLRAASAVLAYKTQDDIAEFVKKYLKSVCESVDIATDYKIEASELLRRSEDVKLTPAVERLPAVRTDNNAEPPEPLAALVARRRARADRMEREMVERMERERGLRSDETADSDKLSSDISIDC